MKGKHGRGETRWRGDSGGEIHGKWETVGGREKWRGDRVEGRQGGGKVVGGGETRWSGGRVEGRHRAEGRQWVEGRQGREETG